ncbi:hypothetical protein [Metasolibacillus meyeri]|uniref:hypothetical protein n=1 Tax=Metasolibacillus meyeri TaxID=1071052 RepID=UPI000D31A8D7|nr:hypothetical protein [Metasolibacillus meyeri]
MQREYFCANCGLYYWEQYPSAPICPDENCSSHNSEDGQYRYACDSMGFAYFAKDHSETIKKIAWSSARYAHENALNHYKQHGVQIK